MVDPYKRIVDLQPRGDPYTEDADVDDADGDADNPLESGGPGWVI